MSIGRHQLMSVEAKKDIAIRTQEEVAEIMTQRGYPMGRGAVCEIERRAIRKLSWGLARIARELGYVEGQ